MSDCSSDDDVYDIASHTGLKVTIKKRERCKALGKEEPHKYGRSIVTSCMSTACKEVNLPPEMSKDTLICNYGPLISQEKYFNPPKNHYLN